MAHLPSWRCGFTLESVQPCGEPATYGGFCDAHTATAVETCLCGAPALGEAALADDMYTAHPTLCEDCAASDEVNACGVCGRLGTEEAVKRHGRDAHYYMRPNSTTATSEEVAQCLAEENTDIRRPTCTACGYVSHSRPELRQHIIEHHLANTDEDADFIISYVCSNRSCGHRHMTAGLGSGGYCGYCVLSRQVINADGDCIVSYLCRRCKGRIRQFADAAEHFASHHTAATILDRRTSEPAVTDWECGVCHAVIRGNIDEFLDTHFLYNHVRNMGCPLPGCSESHPRPWAEPWDRDALQRHVNYVHHEYPTPVPGYRGPMLCFARNAFATARKTVDTYHVSKTPRMMYGVAQLQKATLSALAEYALLLGCEGPLLRELCWARDSSEGKFRTAVIDRYTTTTEPRCIPVGSRKSYANLPADMWGAIMGQLSYKDAVALGQTCRRLRTVYMDVWGRKIDALCDLVLPTPDIKNVRDMRTRGKVDATAERKHWGIELKEDSDSAFLVSGVELRDRFKVHWVDDEPGDEASHVYPVRAVAHAALAMYGSVDAFKREWAKRQRRG